MGSFSPRVGRMKKFMSVLVESTDREEKTQHSLGLVPVVCDARGCRPSPKTLKP